MDFETRAKAITKFKEVALYLIIAVISLCVAFVIPLIAGSVNGDLEDVFPTTTEGWVLWGILNGGESLANVAIFILFKHQAKINVRNDPKFIEANEILHKCSKFTKVLPRSPAQMNAKDYSFKAVSVFVGTALASFTITQLVITFSFITFLSCVISLVITLGFGITTMLNNEAYWTDEYLRYAQMIKEAQDGRRD